MWQGLSAQAARNRKFAGAGRRGVAFDWYPVGPDAPRFTLESEDAHASRAHPPGRGVLITLVIRDPGGAAPARLDLSGRTIIGMDACLLGADAALGDGDLPARPWPLPAPQDGVIPFSLPPHSVARLRVSVE